VICTLSFAPFSVDDGATYDVIHHACTLMLMILIGPLVIKDIVMRAQQPNIAIHAKFLLVHTAANCINLMRDTDIYFEMRTQHQKLRLLRQQLCDILVKQTPMRMKTQISFHFTMALRILIAMEATRIMQAEILRRPLMIQVHNIVT